MQTDGEPPITVVEADGEPPVTVVEANGEEPPVTVVEVVAVEVLATADAVEVLAPAGAVEVLGSSSEAVSAATSDACVCSECKKVHPQSSFSKTQWSKPVEQRRCKSCIGAPPPTKVEVKRMAREQDSQHCQELESGCYSMAPPCCFLRCSWLQFDESKTRFTEGPTLMFCCCCWPFAECGTYEYVGTAAGVARDMQPQFELTQEDCCCGLEGRLGWPPLPTRWC